jgi:hypothetical protein
MIAGSVQMRPDLAAPRTEPVIMRGGRPLSRAEALDDLGQAGRVVVEELG